jgi:integrase
MATGRISARSIKALKCKSGQDRAFLWDEDLAGFGVVAFPSGKQVFVFQYRQAGRSRRVALGDFGENFPPQKARSKAKEVSGAIEGGADPIQARRDERSTRTFKDLADEFLRLHVGPRRKTATGDQYGRLLRDYVLPVLGSRRLDDVRRVDVARLHADLSDRPHTANRCLAVISSVWNWGAGRDEVKFEANPAKGIERNPEQGKERFLSSDELATLGDTLRRAEAEGLPWNVDHSKPGAKHIPKTQKLTRVDHHAAAAIRLLILTGARLREILNAKWEYVNWECGILSLPDAKTGAKTIYLSVAALAVLKGIPRVAGSPYIIPGEKRARKRGEPKPPPSPRADLKRSWEAVARAAGFYEKVPATDAGGKPILGKGGVPVMVERSTVRLHDLRHSFASMGAGASLGLPIIGKLLGHSQPATTARCSHLDADPMRRAADIIGNQIAAAMTGKSADVVQIESGRRKS